jgi:phosphate transport system substrate-binding protein
MKYSYLFLIVLWSCSSKTDTIKIKGSDTEVNLAVLMAEQFYTENQAVLISVSGGGSGLGIASLLNGNTDIANASRSMKAEEFSLFQKSNIELDSFVFAQDAIAFVVSDQLPIDSINTSDIAHILSGDYQNWAKL